MLKTRTCSKVDGHGEPNSKNRMVLMSFINYCASHPDERFWQALRNWAGMSHIWACKIGKSPSIDLPATQVSHRCDTFYWEGHRS